MEAVRIFHVQCTNCMASGYSESGQGLDALVRCSSEAGNPPGSVDGCCSTLGHTHDEHAGHVASTGDASSRPVIITVLPGSTTVRPVNF